MAKWYNDSGEKNDIVLSTRIRLARNLKGIPFPGKMSREDALKVIAMVDEALGEMNYTFTKYDMSKLGETDKQRLVEARFISPNLAASKVPSAAYISEDETISIMVNEEDHIRVQCIVAGKESKKAYEAIALVDTYLSEKLGYAIHEKYGYLTSCLTNVGTGMRISYMMHLPAIVMCKASDGIFSAIGKLGATVRGMYGEGTSSSGCIFQISNQITLGKDGDEIISLISETADSIIAKEQELRDKIYKQQGLVLEDRIMRSYGILKSARIMQSKEMIKLISDVRLGVSLGIIENTDALTLNSLMITASRAHLANDDGSDSDFERDVKRARLIRETL